MIEIAFDESVAGALKFAETIIQGDVQEMMLALDIGDISDTDLGLSRRKQQLDSLFSDFPGVSDAIWETNQAALKRLAEAKAALEPVRMWVCAENPAELCGLYFVCSLMERKATPLSVVAVPGEIEKDGCVISWRGTGDIEPGTLGGLMAYEEPISELRRSVYAAAWNRLAHENAPLRAVVNGSLMGVAEDFYDFALRTNMPEGEFAVAQLIGKTLGSVRGVSDRWLFMRVQSMLRTGQLAEVCAASGGYPYSGVVKRSEFKINR